MYNDKSIMHIKVYGLINNMTNKKCGKSNSN